MRGLSFLSHEGHVGSPTRQAGSSEAKTDASVHRLQQLESVKLPLSFFLLGWYDPYAAFFCCALDLAQRARCAAAILLRAARLIVRTGASTDRLVFAHRAFCASEIFWRADAESVRFALFSFVRIPERFRPTKLPITWIT
jgi:hypothetical protein